MSINIKLDAECDEPHKPPIITKYGLVTDINNICCLQHQILSNYLKSPRPILVLETETKLRKEYLVWTGLANGQKGIGVMKDLDDFMTMNTDGNFLEATEVSQCLLQSKIQIFILEIVEEAVKEEKDNVKKGINDFVNYDEIGIKIFNPIKITEIENPNEINKLIKIQKYGSNNFVRVKYICLVNGIFCLCCIDLIGNCENLPEGTRIEGMFYIPTKEIKSCLTNQEHSQLNTSGSDADYKSICCIKVEDKLDEYPLIQIGVELSKGVKKYKCKWIGKMNEEDIVGIESDTNLLDVNKKLSNLVVPGNEKLIFSKLNTFNYGVKISKSLGGCVIDPTIDIGRKPRTLIDANRIVYAFVGNDRRRGVVKLIGNVYGNEIVGCEMDTKFGSGTDGTFGREKLFDCGYKRGVLIVHDDKLRCCEVDGRHNDMVVDILDKIDERCFCCIRTVKQFEEYKDIVVGQNYSRNNGEKWIIALCNWVGMVNGDKIVGQFQMPEKEGFLRTLWNRQYGKTKQIYFYLDKINADIILCDVVNILIIKPQAVKSFDDETIINKHLIISTFDKKNLIVTQKWKGIILDCPVIGCELNEKSKYGTNGEFNGHKLFSCEDGRGILMVLEGFTKTCANGSHNELLFCKNKMIREENICCIETTEVRNTDECTVGMIAKIGTEIEGVCQWRGKINGQTCVGIESNKALGKEYDGKLSGVKIFTCKSGYGYVTKLELAKIEGNTSC